MSSRFGLELETYLALGACFSSDERDSRTHLLSGKALLQIFGDAFDGCNFLIEKFVGPSISRLEEGFRGTARKISRLWVGVGPYFAVKGSKFLSLFRWKRVEISRKFRKNFEISTFLARAYAHLYSTPLSPSRAFLLKTRSRASCHCSGPS